MEVKSIKKWLPDYEMDCENCTKETFCKNIGKGTNCAFLKDYSNLNLSKPGILIIDDNPGIVSFLEDDLEELEIQDKIDLNNFNIFSFTTNMCAYELIANIIKYKDLNIKYAIIDITLGGTINAENKIIKLTGVDILEILLELNPELNYIFYTGNQMNEHIKTIKAIMDQYLRITKRNIQDKIIHKTELSMDDRQQYILDNVLNK